MKIRTQRTLLTLLRENLGTWPGEIPTGNWVDERIAARFRASEAQMRPSIDKVLGFGELFVGMANGPFLLIMKADDPERFIEFANRAPTHDVHITIEQPAGKTQREAEGRCQSVVRPASDPGGYRLVFGLPSVLDDQILNDEDRGMRLAPDVKRKFFSEITVYRRVHDRDVIYRLVYTPRVRRS